MKRFLFLGASLVLLAGCGDAVLVRPIFYAEGLQERVVDEPDGAWAWSKVLVLEVEGLISAVRQPTLFGAGENPLALLKEKLSLAEADDRVRGVIVRINSPGGTVTASDIIHHELKAFRERTGRPVVALLMDVAASGGYYAACGADRIIAHPTTLTGSIGVLMQWLNVAGTMGMFQMRVETIKAGAKKDMASPFRFITPEEQKLLQEIVDRYHTQFIEVIAASRPNLTVAQVRELADGRVFEAHRARKVGLVDRIGYLDDAVAEVKSLAGVSRVKIVTYSRQYRPSNTAYAQAPAPPGQVNLVNVDVGALARLQQARFMYLWAPGAK